MLPRIPILETALVTTFQFCLRLHSHPYLYHIYMVHDAGQETTHSRAKTSRWFCQSSWSSGAGNEALHMVGISSPLLVLNVVSDSRPAHERRSEMEIFPSPETRLKKSKYHVCGPHKPNTTSPDNSWTPAQFTCMSGCRCCCHTLTKNSQNSGNQQDRVRPLAQSKSSKTQTYPSSLKSVKSSE